MDQYFVDVKAEVTDGWADAVTYQPSNITYLVQDMTAGPCTIAFDILMSDPLLTQDQFGPKRSEWRFRQEGTTISQGIITKVAPIPNDKVQVGGSDYLWYLDQRIFPADYTTLEDALGGSVWDGGPIYISGPGETTDAIIEDIIGVINTYDTDTVVITVVSGGGFGSPIAPFVIVPGDTTSILQQISNLAQQDADIGFEGFINVDGSGVITFYIFATRYQIPPSVYPTITNDMIVGTPTWANNGPASTVEIGWGIGHAISSQSIYGPSKSRFRRLEHSIDYGDEFKSQDMCDALVASWGALNRSPQHDFEVTIYADKIGALILEHSGVVLNFTTDLFMPFHNINGVDYRATQMNFQLSNEGDNLVDLTLEQAYLDGEGEV